MTRLERLYFKKEVILRSGDFLVELLSLMKLQKKLLLEK